MNSQKSIFLKTNDYQENINTLFLSLREDTTFIDVTLAAENGQKVEAHKVIQVQYSTTYFAALTIHTHLYTWGV